ncbi:MAG TPA: hypothetical protein VMR28_02735 [Candidatus Saccharimonadales bacterium]|nr:hypothetical protein [Candidatus Saccharimonadales bacterium]
MSGYELAETRIPFPGPEIITQPEVIWALAQDVHTQFSDSSSQYRSTLPVHIRLMLGDEPEVNPIANGFTLAQPTHEGLATPLTVQEIDSEGNLGHTWFMFKPSHVLPAAIINRHGLTIEHKDEREFPRSMLVTLRSKLREYALDPLDKFDPIAFLDEAREADVVALKSQANKLGYTLRKARSKQQSQDPIKAAMEIMPGLPIFGEEPVSQEYDIAELSLANVIDNAVQHFREINRKRNPGWKAKLSLSRGVVERDVPEEVWRPYYDSLIRTTNFEQLAINRAVARQKHN